MIGMIGLVKSDYLQRLNEHTLWAC